MKSLSILQYCSLLLFLFNDIILDPEPEIEPGFHVGRISEGQYEYSKLNGWLTVHEAAKRCEDDPQCGGFTYKGTYLQPKKPYQVYFFYILVNIDTDTESWKWNYYRANRTFIHFPGLFTETQRLLMNTDTKDITENKARELCQDMEDCVGVELPLLRLLSYVDIDTMSAVAGYTTLVKITNVTSIDDNETFVNVASTSSWNDIDDCCPDNAKIKLNQSAIIAGVEDGLERISCDIPADEFMKRFVEKRIPVILLNCSREWEAQTSWSLGGLLHTAGGKKTWSADWRAEKSASSRLDWPKEAAEKNSDEKLTGRTIQELIRLNATIRVFDKLTRGSLVKSLHQGRAGEVDRQTMQLFSDYSPPSPLQGTDRIEQAGVINDYQWIIASHEDTGTELHTDPSFTSPWNTVLSGYKWWVLMPPEVLPDEFLCSEECSKDDGESVSVSGWYYHVLPQLRQRKFYGSSLKEVIQGPGETIYMPGHLAHAVLNIGETMSVTENYFLPDSLEDWVHGVMMGQDITDDSAGRRDEEIFWRSMYYRQLDSRERALVRGMEEQVEGMVRRYPEMCPEEEEEEEEEEENHEKENEAEYEGEEKDEEENKFSFNSEKSSSFFIKVR